MDWLTLGSFIFFTGLVGLLTWLITRDDRHETSEGYFLAGRSLTGGFIAGSLLLTNLSTEQLVGLNGDAYSNGISVIAWELIAAMSLVVMGLFFLPRYLRSGIATVPEFLQERFDSTTRAITSLIFIFAYAAILLPIILYTGATGMNSILEVREITGIQSEVGNLWITVWVIGTIGAIYAIVGGLRTVAVSDTLNGMGLLLGGGIIAWLALKAVNPENPLAALATLKQAHPERFNSLGGPTDAVPFTTLFSGVLLLNLFYWTTNQQIIQRTFGASSLREGQKGVMIASSFKILTPIILVLPGIVAYHLYAGDEGMRQDLAYGTLVRDVLPRPLRGFFAAAVAGAILSSFNSALNSTATLFSLGVYRYMLRPQATERETIRAGKYFGWIVAVASMTAAPFLIGQESIFGYLQKMNGLYFIPIFSVVLVGMLTKRVPARAANTALVVGFAAIALGYFVPFMAPLLKRIHEFHFLGLVFLGLVGLMLLMGKLYPAAVPWEHRDAGKLDLTPWPLAKPLGALLALIVLAIYLAFADPTVIGFP